MYDNLRNFCPIIISMNFVLRFRVKFRPPALLLSLSHPFRFYPKIFPREQFPPESLKLLILFTLIAILFVVALTHIHRVPRILRGIIFIKVSSFRCARPGAGKASFPGYFQPEISSIPRWIVGGTVFHNYPRYVIIIGGIDETQGGAASTIPRLKRGKVTRWNARATRGSIRNL